MKPSEPIYTAHAIDAEKAVIGSILLDPSVLSIASEALNDDDFFADVHRMIFSTMKELDKTNQPIDLATLGFMLSANRPFNDAGGVLYLSQIESNLPTASRIKQYCSEVRNDSMRRKMQEFAIAVVERTKGPIVDVCGYIQESKDLLDGIASRSVDNPWGTFGEVTKAAIEDIFAIQSGAEKGVDTGFIDLDKKLSGLRPGSLTIIAARPAMGKTALALNIVKNASIQREIATAVFSLEMTSKELAMRILSSISGVESSVMRNAAMNDTQWDAIMKALDAYKSAPIIIDETPGISISAMRDRAKRMKAETDIKLIVVDYLQLMTSNSKRALNREQEVADISRGLKNLAKELKIPIICLAQLNRSVDARVDKRPFLSDLRESGSIEQDADTIIFIHREDYYEKDKSKQNNKAEIIIAKQRAGSTGSITLHWNGATTTFSNYTENEYF